MTVESAATSSQPLLLYQPGGRPWGMPNLSPFCVKLETYLRIADWPYEWRRADFREAPKGKVPYIRAGGQLLGDSQAIIEELERRRGTGRALDRELDDRQRSIGHATRRMLDEALYFALIHLRWGDDAAWAIYRPRIARNLGAMAAILPLIRRSVRRTLRAQGTGRHTPAEIEAAALADLGALATLIGDGPFLFGERPSTFDASAFAFVEGVAGFPHASRVRDWVVKSGPLMSYRARIRARWWADLREGEAEG
jgi:glutathione S-transferase